MKSVNAVVTLEEAAAGIGRRVVKAALPGGWAESGVVVRTDLRYVFVLYDGSEDDPAFPTPPERLTFETGAAS